MRDGPFIGSGTVVLRADEIPKKVQVKFILLLLCISDEFLCVGWGARVLLSPTCLGEPDGPTLKNGNVRIPSGDAVESVR